METNGHILCSQIIALEQDLDTKSRGLQELGEKMADSQRALAVRVRAEILVMAQGDSKLPQEILRSSTLTLKVVEGEPDIAALQWEADVAKQVYFARRDAMENTRSKLMSHNTLLSYVKSIP